jgi:hypothetical protein
MPSVDASAHFGAKATRYQIIDTNVFMMMISMSLHLLNKTYLRSNYIAILRKVR